MSDFRMILPYNYVNGTIADANEVNANEREVRDKYNSSLSGTVGHTHSGVDGDWTKITSSGIDSANFKELVPLGSIIPIYDFNGLLTFDTAYWAYCNGQTKTITGIGPQVLPDLSNRYIVGFGTEGGADIGSAAWSTAIVGNASHQVNLQHAHTVNAHNHDLNNHVHNVPAHYHGKGTLAIGASGSHAHSFVWFWNNANSGGGSSSAAANADPGTDVNSTTATATHSHPNADFTGSVGNTAGSNGDSAFSSGVPTNNFSGSSSPNTNSQLSATQSIQPRSVRVRFIMRIK